MEQERTAAIQRDVVRRLQDLAAQLDPDTVRRAVQAFLDGLDQLVSQIVDADDEHARLAAAHTLAGSAETLGAMQLGADCRRMMADPADPSVRPALRTDAALTRRVLEEFARGEH
jgi:HPt (histidine-containing phosphotransfer) domain-containing protein